MGQDHSFGAFIREAIIFSDSARAILINMKSGKVLISKNYINYKAFYTMYVFSFNSISEKVLRDLKTF